MTQKKVTLVTCNLDLSSGGGCMHIHQVIAPVFGGAHNYRQQTPSGAHKPIHILLVPQNIVTNSQDRILYFYVKVTGV